MVSSTIQNVFPNLVAAAIPALVAYVLSFFCPDLSSEQRLLIAVLVVMAGFLILSFISQKFRIVKEWLARQWRHLVIVFLLVLVEVLLFLVYGDWKIIGFSLAHFALVAIAAWLFVFKIGSRTKDRDAVGWRFINHPQKVVGMAAISDRLYAATEDDKLWVREPFFSDSSWRSIGHAHNIVAMTADRSKLFAVTKNGELWQREPVHQDRSWNKIAQRQVDLEINVKIVTIAVIEDKLFAATGEALFVCDLDASEKSWREIGRAEGIDVMTTFQDRLLVKTHDHRLLLYDPSETGMSGQEIGDIRDITAMAAIKNTVFAVTENRKSVKMSFDGLQQKSRWSI